MIREAVVEPALQLDQVSNLPAGIARFLADRINGISGISTPRDALEELVQARAQLAAAEAQRVQARKEYERLAELLARGLVAQSQVDQQQQLEQLRNIQQMRAHGNPFFLELKLKGCRQ